MTGPENSLEKFLERWSRRKLAATETAAGETPRDESSDNDGTPTNVPGAAADLAAAARGSPAPAFDPASLPPIESINAISDIRAFLAPEVPIELARAALRRAWVTDPTIRDFVGLAENQWNFTQTDGIPGFGPLDLTPSLRRLVAELCSERVAGTGVVAADQIANTSAEAVNQAVASEPAAATEGLAGDGEVTWQSSEGDAAAQKDFVNSRSDQVLTRKHGRALPK